MIPADKRITTIVIIALLAIMAFFLAYKARHYIKNLISKIIQSIQAEEDSSQVLTLQDVIKRTEENYGKEIDELAGQFNLPAGYLKALIMLECSGQMPAPSRFEPHVYYWLKQLKEGKIPEYNGINRLDILDATDEALKNLSSSWGPFQLMGYHCILLGINVKDIREEDALYWGIQWIDLTYGEILRENQFKEAFHIHNTGRKIPEDGTPLTTHPDYIHNGIDYMTFF
jgi:hypothetical protein